MYHNLISEHKITSYNIKPRTFKAIFLHIISPYELVHSMYKQDLISSFYRDYHYNKLFFLHYLKMAKLAKTYCKEY